MWQASENSALLIQIETSKMNAKRFIEDFGVMPGKFDTVSHGVVDHELDDQPPVSSDEQNALFIRQQLRTLERFNGSGDAESCGSIL